MGSGIRDLGTGKNLFRIPDPGVKKAPDPGSGYATLLLCLIDQSFCSVVKEGEEALASCRKLVERMPNLECRNTQQRTPLHVAALAGNQGTDIISQHCIISVSSSLSSTVDYSPLTDCPSSDRKLFLLLNFSQKTLLWKQNLKVRRSSENVFSLADWLRYSPFKFVIFTAINFAH